MGSNTESERKSLCFDEIIALFILSKTNPLSLMNIHIKSSVIKLIISLVVSPVIFYVTVNIAKLFGSSYNITHGESFIIWVLLAILVNLSLVKK